MSVRLVSWNINGIRAVTEKGLFATFVDHLEPDVICLQETKAQSTQVDVGLPDFEQHWNSAAKKGYSGTAIFSRPKSLEVTDGLPPDIIARHHVVGDRFGDPTFEGRVVTAEYERFFLVTVYTPNVKDDLGRLALRHEQWDPAFLAYVDGLQKTKPVVICGDLNVAHTPDDLANPTTNEGKKGFTAEERQGFEGFIDAGFVDTFRLFHRGNGYYTWWRRCSPYARARNVGWRIDYFLVSGEPDVPGEARLDIHPDILGSDHCPVSLTLDLPD